jgi:hypothetical protein
LTILSLVIYSGDVMLIFIQRPAQTRQCQCGGIMVKIEETPQTTRDQCESEEDTFVCQNCGHARAVDEDTFFDRLDTVME